MARGRSSGLSPRYLGTASPCIKIITRRTIGDELPYGLQSALPLHASTTNSSDRVRHPPASSRHIAR